MRDLLTYSIWTDILFKVSTSKLSYQTKTENYNMLFGYFRVNFYVMIKFDYYLYQKLCIKY